MATLCVDELKRTISQTSLGPYAPAILKFKIFLSLSNRPPVIAISTDIFHPLVTPLTTYTYTNSDTGADTVSASDEERLPPGGFSLRHGFPEWFRHKKSIPAAEEQRDNAQSDKKEVDMPAIPVVEDGSTSTPSTSQARCGAVDIARMLYYMRSAFDSEVLLDKVPLEAAGNPGAWHAWQAHRAKISGTTTSSTRTTQLESASYAPISQQPGGARRPGQWNWEGVWEERVKKGILASVSQSSLYSNGQDADLVSYVMSDSVAQANHKQINFLDIDPEYLEKAAVWRHDVKVEDESVPA